MTTLLAFIHGATAMAAGVAALFFLRYWRRTKDRLFFFFAVSFVVLGANRVGVALFHVSAENEPYLYLLRLLAFTLIAFAIVDKNRSAS